MEQGFPTELSPPFGCRWAEQPARRGFAQDRPSPVGVAAPAPRDAVTDRGATVPRAKKSVNAPPSVAVVSTVGAGEREIFDWWVRAVRGGL